MSPEDKDRHGQNGAPEDERLALQALATLPRPQASASARARARELFLASDDAAGVVIRPPERRWRPLVWAPLSAAAVLLLAVFGALYYGSQPAARWFVTDLVEPTGIQIAAGLASVGTEVGAGTISTAGGSELELQLGTQLRFRMQPGSRIELPEPPSRWFAMRRTLRVEQGEIYGTTGGNELKIPLIFETAEARVHIVGTTFAVFRTAEATCVCLWQGAVEVTPLDGGEPVSLQPQMRYYVYKDGRASEPEPIDDMERMKLSMMHDGGLAEPPDEK